jgi:uncharacterized protein
VLRRRPRYRHPHRAPALTDHDDAAVVRRAIDFVGALDIEAAIALTTDDLVLELPFRADGGPRRLEGDDARRFMRSLPKLLAQMSFHDVVVHGQLPSGAVVAEYRSAGITRAGRDYPNAYVAFFCLRDGRIASWREYFDPNVVASAFPSA